MEKSKMIEECCFCGQKLYNVHETNNAMPVSDGRCCHRCNAEIVIPARINLIFSKGENE
jgi:hypothetical protein